ncbi:YjcZ family sporulation protein [Anaerobacillus arseniciselenatis]|nr:YjcZ family sporulation protein [Anaerobacillus arseniciselenatis]
MSDYGHIAPVRKKDNDFALIVVLFILLIIVGTAFVRSHY